MDHDEERVEEMIQLLELARPMMEGKCCHYEWCLERRGVETDNPAEGWTTVEHGMHPGCAPYRRWLDRLQALR